MGITIQGKVSELESTEALNDLVVCVMDADLFVDDTLGTATTKNDGSYSIEYELPKVGGVIMDHPDIYIVVKSSQGKLLNSTKNKILYDVDQDVHMNISVPHSALVSAGVVEDDRQKIFGELSEETKRRYTTLTLMPDHDSNDRLLKEVKKDLSTKASILELFCQYMKELKSNPDNQAPELLKMEKLFELGMNAKNMPGHFYGIPVGLKTGDQDSKLSNIGNIIGMLWGATLEDESPWVGKSFSLMHGSKFESITGQTPNPEIDTYLGINHFNKLELKALNMISFQVLNWWLDLKPASPIEQNNYGYDKNGGHFVACFGRSVYDKTDRDVFQLNYRWKQLDNKLPLKWLVDEMVQIADGLYLGQLLFATKHLLNDYDPERPVPENQYQHFGYFLLFNDSWAPEARRLFPFLNIPVNAPGMINLEVEKTFKQPKFSTFTFEDTPRPTWNDDVYQEILKSINNKPSIMHLLQEYSKELQENADNQSPVFLRLRELFDRGIGIKEIDGFYRGALVSWHSEGLLKFFDLNVINLAWMRIGRQLSTWTGKSFEEISDHLLLDITDGFEKGNIPSRWGSNTQALRTEKERFVSKLMRLAKIWTKPVAAREAQANGYDLKNFFFIAHQAKSVNTDCLDKTIYQFNYRWPRLKTIIPDKYCIDEVVQIAEGLYLGQLMYATNVVFPFEPDRNPSDYKYKNFGYFLLMDEQWHQIRMSLGFDLDNV